ncbi:hypothetical protein E6O75_ATG00154 [Venturia nashicola]|uniref:Ubiquitin-like domain-containing protein n=1 Tax=Venturia nashicola TaxID=86259 RepID=A0A4Z1PHR5_9PEZI|nr:hypothetical protein E6O75_ATG00154 [Venturia nashicola]
MIVADGDLRKQQDNRLASDLGDPVGLAVSEKESGTWYSDAPNVPAHNHHIQHPEKTTIQKTCPPESPVREDGNLESTPLSCFSWTSLESVVGPPPAAVADSDIPLDFSSPILDINISPRGSLPRIASRAQLLKHGSYCFVDSAQAHPTSLRPSQPPFCGPSSPSQNLLWTFLSVAEAKNPHLHTTIDPHPITLDHTNSSAETSSEGEDDDTEYITQHGGGHHRGHHYEYDDDDEDEDESEEEEDEESEDFEDEDASWDILPPQRGRHEASLDIEPSESASRSRQPVASTRTGKLPVGRGPPPRRVPKVPDPPPGSPPQRARARPSRHASRQRRPQSAANLDHIDDYPDGGYGRGRGMEAPYAHAPGYGAGQWGGIPHYPGDPSQLSSPYDASPYAMSPYQSPYQQRDHFASPYGANDNPFTAPPDNYFGQRRNRSSMPTAPPGGEMMRYGAYPPPNGFPPGAITPYGYPPPGYPPHPGYPYPPLPHHTPSPHVSKKSTPAPSAAEPAPTPPAPPPAAPPAKTPPPPPEDPSVKAIKEMLMAQEKREKDKIAAKEKAAAEAKIKAAEDAKKKEEDKLDALQKMIIEHNKQQLEREKKQLAKFEADQKAKDAAAAAAAAAKKAQDERNAELAAAADKAKADAEAAAAAKAAEEKAAYEKKAAEEKAAYDKATADEKAAHDKAIEEATKKAADLEAGKKKAEEEAASLRPGDDMLKPPIKFKDAVGRKFSFPWHICKTWKGMEALIQQAFMHVDVIGQHVHEGHYDLVGPDGEIILPQVYESMVKPDWAITMHMWPMPEPAKESPPLPPVPHPGMGPTPMAMAMPPPMKPHKDKKGKVSSKAAKMMGMPGPPPPPPMMGGLPPPPTMPPPPPGMAMPLPPHMMGPSPMALPPEKPKKKKKPQPTGLLMWAAGGSAPKREKSLKLEKKPESGKPSKSATAEKPSAPNGQAMSRPSAPNGKAVKTTAIKTKRFGIFA